MKRIIMLCTVLLSPASFAGGWVGASAIESYYVYGSGNLRIRLETGDIPTSTQSCLNQRYVYFSKGANNYKEVFSSVVIAKANGTSLNFYVSGCTGGSGSNVYIRGLGFEVE